MLSYQHVYHAGNLADVHKHALLAWVLDYLGQKPKPLSYFETHAGRGLYDLGSEEARKTGEARHGVETVLKRFPPAHPYARAVRATRRDHGAQAYPGSPVIAGLAQRPGDIAHLCDLHPQEHAALAEAMLPFAAVVHHKSGPELLLSMAPLDPRRGLVLIDPSYEVKDDYEAMPHLLYKVHRKWNVAVLMLWYPILANGAQAEMVKILAACNFPGALTSEVRFRPAKPGHGMVGSGVFVVNAPWGMQDEAERLGKLFRGL
jgi:23S rRNA (adenine2030-N6)-methyltransferase